MIERGPAKGAAYDAIELHHPALHRRSLTNQPRRPRAIIATHVRAWARHLVVTDPVHVARAAVMRRDFRTQRVRRPDPGEAVEVRDLAAYDEIFGIDLGLQSAILEVAS